MNFDLKKPCKSCPFRRGEGAVRLTEGRIDEVWETATHSGGTFQCHNTIDYNESKFEHEGDDDVGVDRCPSADVVSKGTPQHCIGAVIAGLNSGEGPNQLARIMGRLGAIDIEAIEKASDEVFSSKEEMLETALWRDRVT